MAAAAPYREAVRADELWLITLMMSAIGLLTSIKWQALFPDLRDYRALAGLPLRPRQVFAAKLTALLLVACGVLITLNFVPSLGFPFLSNGRWAAATIGARIRAHGLASVAACCFSVFALVALQGVVLNLRGLRRVSGYLQGFLVAAMLGLLVLSFSISPRIANAVVEPQWASWLPPVWFLGLYETLCGNQNAAIPGLAHRAWLGLAISTALTLLTYAASYRRHRELFVEGSTAVMRPRRAWIGAWPWFIRDPRQHAVFDFMLQTLARSSHHRMVLMGYGGLGLAVLLTAVTGQGSIERFVWFHLIALLVLLICARHLFSLPVEWKANWVFQLTESEGRGAWFRAMDKFVLTWGALVTLVIPLPLEAWFLGWRGLGDSALFVALGLLAYDCVFYSWEKLPFTCSHLPGKTPMWIVVVQFFFLVNLAPVAHRLLVAILSNAAACVAVLTATAAARIWTHRRRERAWSEGRLKYDETPDSAVYALELAR